MKRIVWCALSVLLCLLIAFSLSATRNQDILSQNAMLQFKQDAKAFAGAATTLQDKMNALSAENPETITAAVNALKATRLAYKKIEYFMEYYFKYPVNLYNRAPVYEIEEPYMEFQAPVGLQVIEDLLLDEACFENKKALLEQAATIQSSAADIPAILYGLTVHDGQIAAAIRQELVRIITLGITGYDAPKLKTGITESAAALQAVQNVLRPLLEHDLSPNADSVSKYLDASLAYLTGDVSFDDFDRMAFLTQAALPLQTHLNKWIKNQHWSVDDASLLNDHAPNLFSPGLFKQDSFLSNPKDTGVFIVRLGAALFAEKKLSGNGKRSCATCHRPDKYFTDALPRSIAFNEVDTVVRNAPSLLYAALQHGQFLDARAASLEEQIVAVLGNPNEMNADLKKVAGNINDKAYRKLFRKAFPGVHKDSLVSVATISRAIAAYERTLTPFNAPFDRYIQGDRSAMNAAQIRGFNLFMGKAQCGTCHFAPVFNGLLPPLYTVTELEVLGVPKNGSLTEPLWDEDEGRYGVFKIKFYKGAFKTPTVRNASATAPYMHNGSFKTMEEVIEFYNKGGGTGIGLDQPTQTLSARPLHLSPGEVKEIAAFIVALQDQI
ncbi:cytochrome-c peroxidase [Taibaiella chishuiensis]|nr:cytochrome c peroxidase [Taibaiella chishuiensis]